MNKRRVLNRQFVVLLALSLIILISIFKIPKYRKEVKLSSLGYQKEEVKLIFKRKLDKEIISNEYYSPYLASSLAKDDFKAKYLGLYAESDEVNDEIIALYERLKALRAYDDRELIKLFANLPTYGITPLLVYEKVNIEDYISDYQSHEDNSADNLVLTANYLFKDYNKATLIENPQDDSYISFRYGLGDYEPSKLVTIPQRYAVNGQSLTSISLKAFTDMCDALARNVEGEGIYAVNSYKSYASQVDIYKRYGLDADDYVDRPGYSDAQLGESVEVVSSLTATIKDFDTTASYKYLLEHAHEFGFINRYPLGKEKVTGYKGNPSYWRYVGEELATAIKKSGLTFDEYYYMYLYKIPEVTK